MAAARRRQRKRRVVQVVVIAGAVLAGALLISALGGDDDAADVASDTTTTTAAAPAGDPVECEDASGDDVDQTVKPEVSVPEEDPPAGLGCTDLVIGDGEEAAVGDTIEAHYVGVGWSDGEQFDASWDRGQPITAALSPGSLIQGWVDGIAGMKVGGRRQLVIPPALAYGDSGHELAGETLVFVIDLVGVEKP
jgi:peptidylprolyl isomerase